MGQKKHRFFLPGEVRGDFMGESPLSLLYYKCQPLAMEGKREARACQAKEIAQHKGWKLKIMKAFQKMLFPVSNHLCPNNDLDSIVCPALYWLLMQQ